MRKQVYLVAIGVGLIDFAVKGEFLWNFLPGFVQGWSWHLFLFAMYVGFAGFVVWLKEGSVINYLGMLTAFGLEDFVFYILKSLSLKTVILNNWYFKTPEAYLITIGYCLVASWILLKEKYRWANL